MAKPRFASDPFWELLVILLVVIPWLGGLALAKGFWSTLFALFPPYAWYLVAEQVMKSMGWLG